MSDLALAKETVRSFCTFHAAERLYGVDVTQVREVSTQVAVTPVPQAPPIVRGLVNLRSRICLALDVRPALGLEPMDCAAESRLIVLHPRVADSLGLLVERGGDIVRVPADQIEQTTPSSADSPASPAASLAPVVGVCKLDAELMMIVDPAILVGMLEKELG